MGKITGTEERLDRSESINHVLSDFSKLQNFVNINRYIIFNAGFLYVKLSTRVQHVDYESPKGKRSEFDDGYVGAVGSEDVYSSRIYFKGSTERAFPWLRIVPLAEAAN